MVEVELRNKLRGVYPEIGKKDRYRRDIIGEVEYCCEGSCKGGYGSNIGKEGKERGNMMVVQGGTGD